MIPLIDLVFNFLVKIVLKRTNVQLDAQTDGKWRVSTRPLVVVNMALTAVMNASAKFSNDGKDTEVNFLIFMRIYLRKVVIEGMACQLPSS